MPDNSDFTLRRLLRLEHKVNSFQYLLEITMNPFIQAQLLPAYLSRPKNNKHPISNFKIQTATE
jgi:hypothetical protein